MSGHSKWANIKHKKAAADAKKGKVFSKLAREITISVRQNGADVSSNLGLRTLLLKARGVNMPADNIDRAVKKGTGELQGERLEEIMFEGFFPGGVAIVVQALTDNRNRTVAEIRHIFSKHGGNLGENGCVSWIFAKKGSITFEKTGVNVDQLMEMAVDAGAEDVVEEDNEIQVLTDPASFEKVKKAFDARGLKYIEARVGMIPQNTVPLTLPKAEQMLKLMEKLEDNDDVQNVYANFDIPDDVMEKLG